MSQSISLLSMNLHVWTEHKCIPIFQEHKQKLEKVAGVRNELKSHIQSLPDLSLLPDVTGGLAPLPSAGDLFATEKDQWREWMLGLLGGFPGYLRVNC